MRLQRLLLWLWLKQWREQRYLYSRLDAYGTFSSFQLYEVLCTSYSVSREVESNQDTNSRISIWIFIRYEVLNIEADHCIDWDTGRDWTCQRNPMQIHQRILISIASLGEDTGSQLLYLCRYSMQITSYCSGPQTCPGTTATQQGKRRSCDEWWVSSTNEPYRESFPMHNGMASQSNTNLVRFVKRCVAFPPADGCSILVQQECYYHVARLDMEDGRPQLCLFAFSFPQESHQANGVTSTEIFPPWLRMTALLPEACSLEPRVV